MKFNTKETKVWFSSDLHLSHKNILKFNRDTRQGETVEEMNQILINNWNSVVDDNDHVFLLGDISFAKEKDTWDMIHQLKGQIHLIHGNHDHVILKSSALKCQFVEVLSYKEIYVDGIKVCLFHCPVEDWVNAHHGSYMLHGHRHGSFNNHILNTVYKRMDVGIDARSDNKMIPFSWEEVHDKLKSRKNGTHN